MSEIVRVIQTASSVPVDGVMQCDGTRHVWDVAGDWDNPAPEQRCQCGEHAYSQSAAVTPLGEGGDDAWTRCPEHGPHCGGFHCCCADKHVSLPPQRSDETRCVFPDASEGAIGTPILALSQYATSCPACDDDGGPCSLCRGEFAGARSGAGAEEAMCCQQCGTRNLKWESELTTLRAQLAEARKEIEELREHT